MASSSNPVLLLQGCPKATTSCCDKSPFFSKFEFIKMKPVMTDIGIKKLQEKDFQSDRNTCKETEFKCPPLKFPSVSSYGFITNGQKVCSDFHTYKENIFCCLSEQWY